MYRTAATVDKVIDKGAVILDKGSQIIDTAKNADYDKVKETTGDLTDRTAKKAGEITDRATEKTTESIGKLKDALKR